MIAKIKQFAQVYQYILKVEGIKIEIYHGTLYLVFTIFIIIIRSISINSWINSSVLSL